MEREDIPDEDASGEMDNISVLELHRGLWLTDDPGTRKRGAFDGASAVCNIVKGEGGDEAGVGL